MFRYITINFMYVAPTGGRPCAMIAAEFHSYTNFDSSPRNGQDEIPSLGEVHAAQDLAHG